MTLPYSCVTFCIAAALLLCDLTTFVQMSPAAYDNTINNLYDALLQREYAGPIIMPNHQVERKAQRSPSLRLRFGRSDPAMQAFMPLEKRWFGEVNQKAIRSPSLRLRFGRRSDPSMPLHTAMDDFLNNKYNKNNDDDNTTDEPYERAVRKPQRLRWGRSLPFTHNNDLKNLPRETDVIDALLNSARVRNLLMNLRQYEQNAVEGHETDYEKEETLATNNSNVDDYDDDDDNNNVNNNNDIIHNIKTHDDMEFQQEVKKNTSPMRLRFGRSIGKPLATTRTTTTAAEKNLIKTGMK